MRHYLKSLIITSIAFYSAFILVPTISLGIDQKNIFIVIAGLLATSLVVRPIFSLILLPFNFLTFGLLSLALNASAIFVFLKFLPGFMIAPYDFPGAKISGFIIPEATLNRLETIIVVAVIITIIQKILHIIFE
ncbi:hypothetical protein A2697_05310 [Candidatus Curtissbacteria bacterium RIFCSPHIGHO2_01_FULL_41_44]|uniref:Uncharacterized protein n=1 Tax=Candidatus Curtissbacteria bacterium RIFCSPLOWO2_01_FULL_42_50 TaxID=1797730 RepID=A0A1F5H499_9BACT|nr:MAG: hypothetical protein A2697_05310 [Candidatus Curtissbacteria bacterium RIFCSPHIGHO2_01_FULL_41_44]OGD93227.1 MAG: hypothetical protein A3C33_04280 [Candidatus Curtissbacteria bacterium RIFCSPHIGHO2_02_FULL_42_58]OGD96867.1 MAG: hypothetical protein A3E71_00290 [Candidatus Curtissbacteria bacterium RIFCSPHIGHO2_12_FULL_42_33]OGD98931.1 MAG: hypothetical protein A3B54_01110 [Candidatus Curtissbacteria bacterium RIFCSPLOWO2_01_FULL_42_50]OGE03475.1 MAG: hypothetical protein A3G16_02670 [Ca